MNIQELKARIDMSGFYGQELPDMPAVHRGHAWVDGGICPFHDDRHRGSFRVNLESGAFRCFSCGAHGGDVIAFVMQRDGVEFAKALDYLKNEWGC